MAAARLGQVRDLLHVEAQAAAEAVGLDLAGQDQQLVVLEPLGVGVEQLLGHHRLDCAAPVVELEDRRAAALAVDDTQVGDDAGHRLRLAAVLQVGDLAAHELAHLRAALVEQMAREVVADGDLLVRQAGLHVPGFDGRIVGLAGGAAVRVRLVAEVEQAALVGMRGLVVGVLEGQADAGQQLRASVQSERMQPVEGAGLDQRLDHALVQALPVDAVREVEDRAERTALGARAQDGLDRALAGALDRPQAVADEPVARLARRRLEAVDADVDIRRLEGDAEMLGGVVAQDLELVGVVQLDGHVRREELGGVMDLDPAGVIGQQRIGGGVRLVEAVAGELLHQVEDLVGLVLVDALLRGALAEQQAVLRHFLGLLLAHRAAQHVGAAEAVAAQHLGGLHHLLLVDHDAVGLGQHRFHQRVRVLDHLAAVLARDEAGDQVHRAGAVERVQRDQVFQPAGLGVAQHALHAARFELEHRLGQAVGEELVDPRVVERNGLEGKVLAVRMARDDELLGQLQDGQRGQAQEVELHQADGLDVVLVVLADG